MGARARIRETANQPVGNLIRLWEKFSGAERTLTIYPFGSSFDRDSTKAGALIRNSVVFANYMIELARSAMDSFPLN